MLPTTVTYDTIFADPKHYAETKIVIGADTYNQSQIVSCERSQSLYAGDFNIGYAVMNEIRFSLIGVPAENVPRMSRVEVWTRLWNATGTTSSEWLPMGVYYTTAPEYDTEKQIVSVTGYDELFKLNVTPFEKGATITQWADPTLRQVAGHIVEGTIPQGWVDIYNPAANPIEQGNLNNSGQETERTDRVRTSGYIAVSPSTQYIVSTNVYNVAVFEYSSDDGTYIQNDGWQTSPFTFTTTATTHYIRLAFRKQDATEDIVPEEVTSLTISVWGNVIDTNFAGVGMAFEDITQIDNTIIMPAIPFEYSVREILIDIAIACCGNWTMVFKDDGLGGQYAVLRLKKMADIAAASAVQTAGRNASVFEKGDLIDAVTRVRVFYGYDANGVALYATAAAVVDDGRLFDTELQTITSGASAQIAADNILAGLGFSNQPFIAQQVNLNPACELGDKITLNGITNALGTVETTFHQGMWAEIEAPSISKDDEFGYETSAQRVTDRVEQENAASLARITVNSNEIAAEVRRATGAEGEMDIALRNLISATETGIRVDLEAYADSAVEAHASVQRSYIEYTDAGLKLGKSGTQARAILTPTALEFQDKTGGVKAYIGEDANDNNAYKFFVINGHIVNQLELGDHWLLVASGSTNDYRLTFKWRA